MTDPVPAEEQCKLMCAWKGGVPCLADDCPRRGAPADTSRYAKPLEKRPMQELLDELEHEEIDRD